MHDVAGAGRTAVASGRRVRAPVVAVQGLLRASRGSVYVLESGKQIVDDDLGIGASERRDLVPG